MDPRFSQLLDDLRRSRFSELAGSRAAIDVALPDAVINRAIAAVLSGSRLRGVTVAAQPGDRLHVDLQFAGGFIPSIGIEVFIERQPELPASPEIVFRWRTIVPGLAAIAGSAAAFFKALPPGVRLEADRVFLDFRPLAATAGVADLLPLLSDVRVATRQGAVDVHLVARVAPARS